MVRDVAVAVITSICPPMLQSSELGPRTFKLTAFASMCCKGEELLEGETRGGRRGEGRTGVGGDGGCVAVFVTHYTSLCRGITMVIYVPVKTFDVIDDASQELLPVLVVK